MSEVETQAKLKWEVACERLRFALDTPTGEGEGEALDLAEAFLLVQAALDELRTAFLESPSRGL